MRAVQLTAYDGKTESLTVAETPVPHPGRGQVLVRVSAAPINPSDLMFLRGLYGFRKKLPVVPGFEGSGTVLAAGGGLLARALVGRRVACATADPSVSDGTWAEYLVTSAHFCVPLRKDVETEQAATMLVNPCTAWALIDNALRGRHRAVLQTAAASALGRMILKLGHRFSVPVINVVRRKEQVDLLLKMGADDVLDSSEPEFDRTLKALCRQVGATLAFDAVAGEMTGRILRAMPSGSRVLVYGALSLQACQIDPSSLIFEGKRVEGFWLSAWLRQRSLIRQLQLARQVQRLLAGELKTEVQARLPLEEVARGLALYNNDMTAGKILLLPGQGTTPAR
jgi:NADPH2:quinone reductase